MEVSQELVRTPDGVIAVVVLGVLFVSILAGLFYARLNKIEAKFDEAMQVIHTRIGDLRKDFTDHEKHCAEFRGKVETKLDKLDEK